MSDCLWDSLDKALRIGVSFDIIKREIKVADRTAYLYCIDEFTKDDILEKIQEFFYSLSPEDLTGKAEDFQVNSIPYIEVDYSGEIDSVVTDVLSGMTAVAIQGYDKALLIDCRTYPVRSLEEPDKDKSLRGSRDGFVETFVSNIGLIRRRIRTPEFTVEALKIGRSSKTDVAVCYMEGRVDKNLVQMIIKKAEKCNIDALTMNQESFVNALFKRKWYDPLPKFKFTERPDTAAAAILEGQICVLVDNSPSAILIPMTLFDITEEANDFYFPRITGAYLRISRLLITFSALLITPLFLLATMNPDAIPESLAFISVKEPINVPIIWQLMILEIAIDGMKLAAVNTPNMLSTPLSVIAALIIGDFAASSGWFNAETMLYMAFVAIANFTHQSYELGYAIKFMRIFLLILTALFNVWGFGAGILLLILFMCMTKSVSGKRYLYPLFPLNIKELWKRLTLKKW